MTDHLIASIIVRSVCDTLYSRLISKDHDYFIDCYIVICLFYQMIQHSGHLTFGKRSVVSIDNTLKCDAHNNLLSTYKTTHIGIRISIF